MVAKEDQARLYAAQDNARNSNLPTSRSAARLGEKRLSRPLSTFGLPIPNNWVTAGDHQRLSQFKDTILVGAALPDPSAAAAPTPALDANYLAAAFAAEVRFESFEQILEADKMTVLSDHQKHWCKVKAWLVRKLIKPVTRPLAKLFPEVKTKLRKRNV